MAPSTTSSYERFNYTELYQKCIKAKILVLPTTPRNDLIAYLEGTSEPPDLDDNVFNSWRHAITAFLLDHWKQIETQVTCPAKFLKHPINPNPKPCFGCTDAQVTTCLVQNHENEKLIEALRLSRRPK